VLALAAACIYLFVQLNDVKSQLAATGDKLEADIAKLSETSSVTTATSRRNIDKLESDLAKARAQAAQLSGQAKEQASAHADELAAKLQRAQDEQGKQIAHVGSEVSAVKTEASAATTRIGEVSTEVATVKTTAAKTQTDLEKTIADLKSTRGDLGVQSGLIATNGKELSALKQLGERNYTDFKIAIAKHKKDAPQKVGDLQVVLLRADPKKQQFSIEVIADDKHMKKENRTVNEPVQFLLSRASIPYELVVNDVKKDMIIGYVSAPKVQQPRGSQ
jgi:chromosome segregation ATPase